VSIHNSGIIETIRNQFGAGAFSRQNSQKLISLLRSKFQEGADYEPVNGVNFSCFLKAMCKAAETDAYAAFEAARERGDPNALDRFVQRFYYEEMFDRELSRGILELLARAAGYTAYEGNGADAPKTPPSYTPYAGGAIRFGKHKWTVLEVSGGHALILTKGIIEQRVYNNQRGSTTWANCSLRQYLNGEFYAGFSDREKSCICETNLRNSPNPWYETDGGNYTKDRIFLLSIEETAKYFGDSGFLRERDTGPTVWQSSDDDSFDELYKKGVLNDQYNANRVAEYNGSPWWWWLRTPGRGGAYGAAVGLEGGVLVLGPVDYGVLDYGGVRPALRLRLY
jgi:hypothetical protein